MSIDRVSPVSAPSSSDTVLPPVTPPPTKPSFVSQQLAAVKADISPQARQLLAKYKGAPVVPVPSPPAPAAAPKTSLDVNGPLWLGTVPSGSTLQKVGFKAANYQTDINYFVTVDNKTPMVDLYVPASWGDRDNSNNGGTGLIWQKQIPVPADLVIPDARPGYTPNNPTTIYNKDTGEVMHLNAFVRPVAGGPAYAYRGSGTHAGSGLSGGEITQAELDKGEINHAIAINVEAVKFLSFANGKGFTPPATKADAYANADTYKGPNPNVLMGSRLALSPELKPEQLGITSPDGKTLFNALQKYGAYIVDDTAWDSFSLNTDAGAATRVDSIQPELHKLYNNLSVVLPK